MSDDALRTDDIGSTAARTDTTPATRRRFLGALGVSGLGVTEMGSLLTGGDDTVTLVVAKLGDRPLRTETVPAPWYRQTRRAERVRDRLERTLLPEPGVSSVGVGLGDRSIGGYTTKAVTVGTRPGGADVTIPDEVDGVPVVENRGETFEFTDCYINDYDPVIGGVAIEDLDTDSRAATCCRCYRDGTYYMLTVRHLFSSGACDDTFSGEIGSDVYQNLDYFGTVDDTYTEHDSALVKLDPNGKRSGLSPDVVDSTVEIAGRVTKSGVSTMQSNGSQVDRRGLASCTDTHQIEAYDQSLSCSDTAIILTEQIFLDGTANNGDSGGPAYDDDGDSTANLVNMISGNTTSGYIFGASAYGMHNLQDLQFT